MKHPSSSSNFETAEQGRKIVAQKLIALGAQDIIEQKEGRRIFILAKNIDRTKRYKILIKTRRSGTWQLSTDDGKVSKEKQNEINFWVFVDINGSNTEPDFYVVPEWWIQNNIHEVHQKYLSNYGGKRKLTPNSKHHAVKWDRVKDWFNRWDLIKIKEV